MTDLSGTASRASALLQLHRDPKLLTVVNVWDVISATVVADVEGTAALATASHSIAASYGYEDGENIPVDLMIEAVGRIVAATDLPVTADLEGGYGDPAETVALYRQRVAERKLLAEAEAGRFAAGQAPAASGPGA